MMSMDPIQYVSRLAFICVGILGSSWFLGCEFRGNSERNSPIKLALVSGSKEIDIISNSFKQRMSELGYIEGQHVIYDFYHEKELDMSGANFLTSSQGPSYDLVVTYPTITSLRVKQLSEEAKIPMVFALAETQGNDLIEHIHSPGTHLTGVRAPGVDVHLKRLELFKEIVPHMKKRPDIFQACVSS